MKIIGIVGSRRRDTEKDFTLVRDQFEQILSAHHHSGIEIVSGGCPRGADKFAEKIAKDYQVPIKIYYAEWNTLGKSAGFARNGLIARDADILIACVAPDRTGGAEDGGIWLEQKQEGEPARGLTDPCKALSEAIDKASKPSGDSQPLANEISPSAQNDQPQGELANEDEGRDAQ